jgi:hypothetical protein
VGNFQVFFCFSLKAVKFITFLTTVYFLCTLLEARRRAISSLENWRFKMPAIGDQHIAGLGYRDSTGEIGRFEIPIYVLTPATLANFLTEFGDFQTKTDAITLGTRATQFWTGDRTTVSNATPSNQAAQREAGLYVTYRDVTTEEEFHVTIPTIDFSKLVFIAGGKDAVAFKAPAGNADIIAWVASFESIARSPRDYGHDVEVVKMRFVGRNS